MAADKKPTRRIKLNQSLGGTATNAAGEDRGPFVHLPGATIEWDAAEAEKLVARGIAEFAPAAK